MRRNEKNRRRSAGFTLAELLIIVAIVTAMVGISIPLTGSLLESSRERTDVSAINMAISKVAASSVTNGAMNEVVVDLTQKTDKWQTEPEFMNSTEVTIEGEPMVGGKAHIYYNAEKKKVTMEQLSATGNISYHPQGIDDDSKTLYVTTSKVTYAIFGATSSEQLKNRESLEKVVMQAGSGFTDGEAQGFFNGMTNLKEIDMYGVKIEKFSWETFGNCPNLEKFTCPNVKPGDAYDMPGVWYYDAEFKKRCAKSLYHGVAEENSRLTSADNGKTIYRKVD